MHGVTEYLNTIGEIVAGFAGRMLLQSSILILVLLCVDTLLHKRVRAVSRYCVWMLVLIKLILPTSLSSPTGPAYWFGGLIPQIEYGQQNIEALPVAEDSGTDAVSHMKIVMPPPARSEVRPSIDDTIDGHVPPPVSAEPMTWQAMLFVIWLLIVTSMLLLLIQRTLLVRGLVRQSKVADGFLPELFDECREQMCVGTSPALRISPNVTAPSVCGLVRPVVLLPKEFKKTLDRRHLRAVLLHELAHIKRKDLWVSLIQTLLQIVYFYNPLLWVANLTIRKVREQAVDETVLVAMGDEASNYPQVLVDVFRFSSRRPQLSLSMIGVVESRKSLAGRVKHIVSRPFPKSAKVGLAGVAIALVAAAVLLPMGAARAELAGGADDIEAEMQVLEALNEEIEALCVPAKGTLRHAIESRYGKGTAVNSAEDLSEVDNPASTYWVHEFCENGSLLVCYDSESLSEVQWARYVPSPTAKDRPESPTDEQKLERLRLRQKQMQSIFFEHTRQFGKDTKLAWGKATDDVRVRIRGDRKSWPAGSDPSFQFDIHNESKRTLFIAYPQSCKVEVNGTWHTANYMAYGYPRSIPTDGRMTFSIMLGDFLSDGAEKPGVGRHTVRVALCNIAERDNTADEKTPIRFSARKFEATSNLLDIEIVPTIEDDTPPQEPVWGPAVKGLQCRLRANEKAWQQGRIPELLADLTNQGPGNWEAALTRGDWELEIDGNRCKPSVREPRNQIIPLESGGKRQDLKVPVLYNGNLGLKLHDLQPGDHTLRLICMLKATSTRAAEDPLHVTSNLLHVTILPVDDDIPWGEPVEGVQSRLRVDQRSWPQGIEPKLFVDLRNQGTRDLTVAIESESWEIEIDGKWHKPSVFWSGLRRYFSLGPGQRQFNVEVWTDDKTKLRQLTLGRHSLRVAKTLPSTMGSPVKRPIRVVSNPVEIEVVPTIEDDTSPAEPVWGPAVEGVQVAIHSAQEVWKYGQIPSISVDVRNTSENDIPFDESKHLLQLQVDGVWHQLFYPKDRKRWGIRADVLAAGQTYEGIQLTCGGHWHSLRGALTLRPFREGGHILRVAYLGPDGMRAESPSVRINVVHPMFDPATSRGQRLIGERFSPEDVLAYHKRVFDETSDSESLKALYLNIAMAYRAKAYHGDNLAKRLKAIQGYTDQVLAETYKDTMPYVFLTGVERALALGQAKNVELELYDCLRDAWYYQNPARAAEVRLASLRCLLKYDDLPAKAPVAPTAVPMPSGLIIDDDELNKKIHERYERSLAELEEHRRIMRLLDKRQRYTHDVIGAYRFYLERVDKSLVPEALGNLHRLVVRYIGDERTAERFVEAVKGNSPAPAVTRPKGPVVARPGGGETGVNETTDNLVNIEIPLSSNMEPDITAETDVVDFSGGPIQGVQVSARIAQRQWSIGREMPRIDVEIRIADATQFQESGLSEQALAHDLSAVALEVNGKQYKNHVEYLGETWQGSLRSPFKLTLILDDEWQAVEGGKSLQLAAGLHTIRVLFVGLGVEPPPSSDSVEIEILREDWTLEPWPYAWGTPVRGVSVSAHAAVPSWPEGSEPVIRVGLRNGGNESWSIHQRPSSFALEVDGKRYENNFIFHVWQHPFRPGDVHQFDLKLSRDRPWHDGLRQGNSWPPVGKSPPLSVGKHTMRLMFTELGIKPEPASLPFEIEIVAAKDAAATKSPKSPTLDEALEELAMVVFTSLKNQDVPLFAQSAAMSRYEAQTLFKQIQKAFPDGEYPPPFYSGFDNWDGAEIIEGWGTISESGKKTGINWSEIELTRIDVNVGSVHGITGGGGSIFFSADGDEYEVMLDDCYVTGAGWRLADDPIWKGKVRSIQSAGEPRPAGPVRPENGEGSAQAVQVNLHSTKNIWNQDHDPAFRVTIRNTGTRELKTSLIASLALEIDGKPYAPRCWWRSGLIPVKPFGPGQEYSLDITLGQFVAEKKGTEELPPGKHTIRAVYLNNVSEDGRALDTSLSRYQEMALGHSEPVEISIILAEAKWGPPTNGLRAALELIPEKTSYTQGECVAVRFHVQNVGQRDIEFKSISTRQDYAQVKDKDGSDIKVHRRFHSGTVYTREHTIKPTDVLVLETTGLGFAEEDQALDEFKANRDYVVGSILRSKPGTYAVHYNVNRDLKTGIRKVLIEEKPQIELNQVTMRQAIETLARKYRVRLCFEDIIDEDVADSDLQPYRLTGYFKAPTIVELLDQLTKAGPFTWTEYNGTYVVYPRENSLLEHPVSINVADSPLEWVARKVLDNIPAGKEIEIRLAEDLAGSNASRMKDVWSLSVSSSPARYSLSRAAEETGKDDTEIIWTFTKEEGRLRLFFYDLPRPQENNGPEVSAPAEASSGEEPKAPSGPARSVGVSTDDSVAVLSNESFGHPGWIKGVVLSAVDRTPVGDAYVGVGDFGDSGGSNHARHREQGLYGNAKTDAEGRFEIDGLVPRDSHLLFVTHPDLVRYDQNVKVTEDDPPGTLELLLKPAARIEATVVDKDDNPLPGHWSLRLEALDGHRFILPTGDPHLSAFATPVWFEGPRTMPGQLESPKFSFGQLQPGEYRIDVLRYSRARTGAGGTSDPRSLWDPAGFVYHGSFAKVVAVAGRKTEIKIRPQEFGTTLHAKMPVITNQKEFPKSKDIPAFVSISRNPGLSVWDSDMVYSLEDARLGRIMEQALFFNMAGSSKGITVRNLPPGDYTVFAGPAMFMNARQFKLTDGQSLTVQPPPVQIPTATGRVDTGRLRRRVQLDARRYSLRQACRIFTERTQSRPRIIAEPDLAQRKLDVKPGSYEIWDLIEELHADWNWHVAERDNQTLVITAVR